MPKWFARLFAVVMIVACLATAWYAYQHEKLNYTAEDVRTSLETSLARERKQQYEYNEVSEKLPEARAELERLQPLADAAVKEEQSLRDQRKTLREGNTDLTASIALSEAEAGTALASVTDLMTTMDEKDRQLQNEMTNALNALVRSLPAGGQ